MSSTRYRYIQAFQLFLKQLRSKEQIKPIGEDHMGNQYFEEFRSNSSRGIHRYYRPRSYDEDDPLRGVESVPPLWDAWLRFRRQEPPTEDEIKSSEKYFEFQQELAKKSQVATKPIDGEFPKLPLDTRSLKGGNL